MAFDPQLDLRLERVIRAPRALVWQAWTDPRHLVHWFTPPPVKTTECRIDLRPGGEFFARMVAPDGTEMINRSCYLEVVAGERLVWTDALLPGFRPSGASFMTAMLTFADCPEGTLYAATAIHQDLAGVQRHKDLGYDDGAAQVAQQLETYCQQLKG